MLQEPQPSHEPQSPLKIVCTTPIDILRAGSRAKVAVGGREAITVVFSRPVTALGEACGRNASAADAGDCKLPFRLSCPVPGKSRWVTTTIARFDPDVDWPTDLDCTLNWDTGLTSYDGSPLQLDGLVTSRRLVAKPLAWAVAGVISQRASALSDGLWDGTLGSGPDVLPEIPPDGRLVLQFNHPVNLYLLRKELELSESKSGRAVDRDLSACGDDAWAMAAGVEAGSTSASSPSLAPSGQRQQKQSVNTTCVEVTPKSSLRANTSYTLRLPCGARYHALAGRLGVDLTLGVGGLRPFRLPLRQDPSVAVSSRRLDLWLPHGLSDDVSPAALAASLALCRIPPPGQRPPPPPTPAATTANASSPSGCLEAVPFKLALLSRGLARLEATGIGLLPGSRYRMSVAARASVKDGYGQPLQASSTEFVASHPPYTFAVPSLVPRSSLLMLEAGADTLAYWPYAVHPPPPLPSTAAPIGSNGTDSSQNSVAERPYGNVSSWAPDLRSDAGVSRLLQVLLGQYDNADLSAVLGAPYTSLLVPHELISPMGSTDESGGDAGVAAAATGARWQELRLPLTAAAPAPQSLGVRVVRACCTPSYDPDIATAQSSTDAASALASVPAVLLNSSLSVSVVQAGAVLTAWVLDGALGGGPVAGAVVSWYQLGADGSALQPELSARCTTDANGTCNVTLVSPTGQIGTPLAAWAVAGGQAALLPSSGCIRAPPPPPAFAASLVADRLLVAPGEVLKVTGFVQEVVNATLQLPGNTQAVLELRAEPEPGPWSQRGSDFPTGGRSGANHGALRSSETADDFGVLVQRVLVMLNGSSGTLHGEIHVPSDATPGRYTVLLRLPPMPPGGVNSASRRRAAASAQADPWVSDGSRSSSGDAAALASQRRQQEELQQVADVQDGGLSESSTVYNDEGFEYDSEMFGGGDASGALAGQSGRARRLLATSVQQASSPVPSPTRSPQGTPPPSPNQAWSVPRPARSPTSSPTPRPPPVPPPTNPRSTTTPTAANTVHATGLSPAASPPPPPPPFNANQRPPPPPRQITPVFGIPPIPAFWFLTDPPDAAAPPPVIEIDLFASPPPKPPSPKPPSPRPPPAPKASASGNAPPLPPAPPSPPAADTDDWPVVARLGVVVGRPRPPSVELELITPGWASPTGRVHISVAAASYLGAPLAAAGMTLAWATSAASGSIALETDEYGTAYEVIDLATLPPGNRTEGCDRLSLRLEWVGPTRERVVRTAIVILAGVPARLALSLSLTTDLPGVAFAPAATLTSNANGATLPNVSIAITLKPELNATAAAPTGAGCRGQQSCTIASGAPFSQRCQLSLPCVGRYRLTACADVPSALLGMAAAGGGGGGESVRVCTSRLMGRSAAEWAALPWARHESPVMQAELSSYAVGDSPVLLVQVPWPLARLLLVWGGGAGGALRSKAVTQLPAGGLARVTIGPLGSECAGGCSVTGVLDVPRLSAEDYASYWPLVSRAAAGTGKNASGDTLLLTSRLFDPSAPHTHVMGATLTVAWPVAAAAAAANASGSGADAALLVSVAVTAAGGGGGVIQDVTGNDVLAVEPGQKVTVTVAVSRPRSVPVGSGVEVTVYAVDKAFLDQVPYDLSEPQQQTLPQLAADMQVYGVEPYRIAPGAVRAVYDKLMTRLTDQDPWLPADTTVGRQSQSVGSPLAAVDADDISYRWRFASPITVMPEGASADAAPVNDSTTYASSSGLKRRAITAAPLPQQTAGARRRMLADANLAMGLTTTGIAPAAATAAGSGAVIAGFADAPPPEDEGTEGPYHPAPSPSPPLGSAATPASVRTLATNAVTPLFTTAVTGADGRAVVSFTAPSNLGTYVVRAFAAAGSSAMYGSGEGKLAVRRLLSLTPSVPRFVRVGDSFEAGVVVTVGSAPATVTVTAAPQAASGTQQPLLLTGTASRTVTLYGAGPQQREVRFSFTAAAIGTASLTFTAADSQPGEGQDALELEIAVEVSQPSMWTSTSFVLSAGNGTNGSSAATGSGGNASAPCRQSVALPSVVPGSGVLSLEALVGHYGAVSAAYKSLLAWEGDGTHVTASSAVLWATLPAVLSYYGEPMTDDATAVAAVGGFDTLSARTDTHRGLLCSDRTRGNRTDLLLNTWALFLVAQHCPSLTALPPSLSVYSSFWTAVRTASLPAWRAAVGRQLVEDAATVRAQSGNRTAYSDWHKLAWARLALGVLWDPRAAGADEAVASDLSLSALLAAYATEREQWKLQTRLVLSVALQALGPDDPAPTVAPRTLDEVRDRLRPQGGSAYLAVDEGSPSACSLSDQALALLLMLRASMGTTVSSSSVAAMQVMMPKLAAYVASALADVTAGGSADASTWTGVGLAVAALAEYDRARGSSQPSLNLTVRGAARNGSSSVVLAQASFGKGSGGWIRRGNASFAWPPAQAPAAASGAPSSGTLELTVSGRGEASVSASLHFVPTSLLSYPVFRGLYVESALQLVDPLSGGPTGRRLRAVPLGATLALTLQVTSPDDLGAVTLEVMMPGGLEPLDPTLHGTARDSEGGGGSAGGGACGCKWNTISGATAEAAGAKAAPPCPTLETRPSRVTCSYAALRAGTSSVTVRAVAATAGTFVHPPARAFAVQQPELMGMTAAGSITVCADCKEPTYEAK